MCFCVFVVFFFVMYKHVISAGSRHQLPSPDGRGHRKRDEIAWWRQTAAIRPADGQVFRHDQMIIVEICISAAKRGENERTTQERRRCQWSGSFLLLLLLLLFLFLISASSIAAVQWRGAQRTAAEHQRKHTRSTEGRPAENREAILLFRRPPPGHRLTNSVFVFCVFFLWKTSGRSCLRHTSKWYNLPADCGLWSWIEAAEGIDK